MRAALTARSTRRLGAAVAGGSLIAAALLGGAPATAAPLGDPTTPDLAAASAYLVGQLTSGTHYESLGAGVTIDAALALAATGGDDAALSAITAWVAANSGQYTLIGTEFEQYVSGGEVAKVALLAEATGHDPRSFGGVDLLGALSGLECTAPDPAAPAPCAAAGNYAGAGTAFAQSLGVLAQLRGGEPAAAPLQFLASLQLPSGAWASAVSPGGAADIDSTAMAAMALALDPSAASRTAVAKALAWIAGQQLGSGGFPGTAGDSTNTAGLAIQALRLDAPAYLDAILSAETALAAQQNADGGFDISVGTPGSDVRATAQAAGGAAGIPFGSLLRSVPALTAADAAAAYLVAQLVEGTHLETSYMYDGVEYSYADQGLTADAVFALQAHGGYPEVVGALVAWLATQVVAYTDPNPVITPDTNPLYVGPYSGGLSKLALIAEATGGDPHNFGGFDLLGIVTDRVCTGPDAAGTCTAAGEFYQAFSSISQSFGVLALQASPIESDHLAIDSPPVVRLAQLQCADGGFSSSLIAPGAPCTSDVDATGYAVQALAAVAGTDLWLGRAQQYLLAQQAGSGLFPGTAGDNGNTSGLAAIALQSLTESLNAPTASSPDQALTPPIVAWQSSIAGLLTLAAEGGGFGLTDAATADSRSTTQALLAVSFGTLATLSGAPLQSAPRIEAVIAPPTEPPVTTEPTTSAPAPSEPAPSLTPDLAATGPQHAASLSLWGAALVAVGAGALLVARPLAPRTRRH